MKLFDSHAHLASDSFDGDRQALLKELRSRMSGLVECAAREADFPAVLALMEKERFIYGAFGVHPEYAAEFSERSLLAVKSALGHEKAVAVGEIGLDYYYNGDTAEQQKTAFRAQLALAKELNRPVVIHQRDAWEDLFAILGEFAPVKGVLHCFTGNGEQAEQALSLGLYLGFGGILTFKNPGDVPKAVAAAPLDRILLETDSPYLAPAPHRGKRNNPFYVEYTAEKLAALKGLGLEETLLRTEANARTLFGIP